MPHTKSETTFWCPKLIDFQGLFAEQRPNAANACPAGFPNGSSLLLTGPPGAGKTTLALAMIRDLMRQKKEAHIIILSNEITRNKLQFDFADFGWFQEDDAVFATNRCRHASLSNACSLWRKPPPSCWWIALPLCSKTALHTGSGGARHTTWSAS